MYFFLIMILGIAIFGGPFVRFTILGIPIIYLCIIFLCTSYIKYFFIDRKKIVITTSEKYLLFFTIYGLLRTGLSAIHATDFLVSDDLFINTFYIPRQAYYLFFLPLIAVFGHTNVLGKVKKDVCKFQKEIFYIVYFFNLLFTHSFSIGVPTELFLCYVASAKKPRHYRDLIMSAIILFTPIAVGGEFTNAAIRIIYFAFMFFPKAERKIHKLIRLGIRIGIVISFTLPFAADRFSNVFDANSFWRLRYWADELYQLIMSYFLGVGYGTSFATEHFVGSVSNIVGGPFGATSEYSVMDKLFVTGPHNSFISIAFRLGILGIWLWLIFLNNLDSRKSGNKIFSRSTSIVFYSSIFIVLTNVGLESPYYMSMFVFGMGSFNYEANLHHIAAKQYDKQICNGVKTESKI